MFAYADNTDISGRQQATFISLEKAAREMNLQINQEKTKYTPVIKKDGRHSPFPHNGKFWKQRTGKIISQWYKPTGMTSVLFDSMIQLWNKIMVLCGMPVWSWKKLPPDLDDNDLQG